MYMVSPMNFSIFRIPCFFTKRNDTRDKCSSVRAPAVRSSLCTSKAVSRYWTTCFLITNLRCSSRNIETWRGRSERGGRHQECACLRTPALLSFNWKFSLTYLPLINLPWKFHVINSTSVAEEEVGDGSIQIKSANFFDEVSMSLQM